jgi:hypothetical protein
MAKKWSIESKAGVEKTCQLKECGLEKVKEIYNGTSISMGTGFRKLKTSQIWF